MSSTVEIGTTRDGVTELRRHWQASTPWAQLLLVHGIAEHSGRYERTGALMVEAGIDVHGFDLVGFGASGGSRGDLDDWATYLDQVEDNLAPLLEREIPTVLMGHSLGGLIVSTYGLSPRPQTDLVVLSSPALGAPQWQKTLAGVLVKVLPKVRIPGRQRGKDLSRDPEVGRVYFKDPLVDTKATPRLAAIVFDQMETVTSSLSRYQARTLVFHGGDDKLVLPEYSEAIGALPGSDRTVYEGLVHETLNEPDGPEVVSDIVDWIRQELSPKP
jgi:acylglycerol lipase